MSAPPRELEELTAELWKLDHWIEHHETQMRINRILKRREEAQLLELLTRQAHTYAGRLRTIRAERLEAQR